MKALSSRLRAKDPAAKNPVPVVNTRINDVVLPEAEHQLDSRPGTAK